MPNLTCPYPSNVNPLYSNGFMFSIQKLPELKYFCQTANIPSLSLGISTQSSPFSDSRIPGDKLEFESLNIEFIVDEGMDNYMGIHAWIKGLGFPKSYDQYIELLSTVQQQNISELEKNYSDATLTILNSNFNPVKSLSFINLFPISINTIPFTSTNTDAQPIIASATFIYTYYEFI
jgi:hypothetical protein